MSGPNPIHDDATQRQFVELLLANQRRVTTYIATLLCNPPDVDDLFQEASVVMWQKFGTFQPGTSFAAWACRIAHLKVLEFRRRQRRGPVLFSDETLESLAGECTDHLDEIECQHAKLSECVAELDPAQQQLLQVRFAEKSNLKSTAQTLGRAINTVRRRLTLLYAALLECVAAKTAEDERR